jgi:fluoride ion exporter CrcB/FEX
MSDVRTPSIASLRPSGTFVHVIAGAALGGALRAAADFACMRASIGFEWPTLGVNIIGCAVAAGAFRWIHAFDSQGNALHAPKAARVRERAIIAGFCGALTTMSAVASMAAASTAGGAALFMALNAAAALASAGVGWWLATLLPRRSHGWRR